MARREGKCARCKREVGVARIWWSLRARKVMRANAEAFDFAVPPTGVLGVCWSCDDILMVSINILSIGYSPTFRFFGPGGLGLSRAPQALGPGDIYRCDGCNILHSANLTLPRCWACGYPLPLETSVKDGSK